MFATSASTVVEATQLLQAAGYALQGMPLQRKLDPHTGHGFWEVQQGERRVLCYGPGEYVEVHWHDCDERFVITGGDCAAFASVNGGQTWLQTRCDAHTGLTVPAGVWHCLLAGPAGLCMHSEVAPLGRTTEWVTDQPSVQYLLLTAMLC
jgi:hypothetical protein